MKLAKHYAVKEGKKPGIYTTWDEAKAQVEGVGGAVYKSFKTLEEAEAFMEYEKPVPPPVSEAVNAIEAYVDGSFDRVKGRYSFGAAIVQNGEVIDTLQRAGNNPIYVESGQNAGEVFGCLHAVQWAINKGYDTIYVYYDFEGIEKWISGEWKAKKQVSQDYVEHFRELSEYIDVEFVKVKAHSGVQFNELADQLAAEAIDHIVF